MYAIKICFLPCLHVYHVSGFTRKLAKTNEYQAKTKIHGHLFVLLNNDNRSNTPEHHIMVKGLLDKTNNFKL